ncbi:MAG: hypothetical protein ACI9QC_000590 [Oceanicoccus sp.]|jgi:hypothetical protein
MQTEDSLQKALRLVETAEAALKAARVLLKEQTDGKYTQVLKQPEKKHAISYDQGETQVIEGHFNGQSMMGPGDKVFPVPANYASKSKLVEGDRLKLTIMPNGSFIYKQISPVERLHIKGTLTKEDGQFRVAANGKNFRVLLASVTYYKGDVGDEVTLVVPDGTDATWGTIEAVIPHVKNRSVHDDGEMF